MQNKINLFIFYAECLLYLFRVSKKREKCKMKACFYFALMGAKNFIDHTRNGSAYYVVLRKKIAA